MAYKGKFTPTNPKKYQGNASNIVWRSTWELRLMKYLDEDSSVISWGSEEIVIPYISPLDNKPHRYYPDFHVTLRQGDGSILRMVVEVKPFIQTRPPTGKRNTRHLREQINTYAVNKAKWDAAEAFCKKIGAEFRKVTEHDLFGKPGK